MKLWYALAKLIGSVPSVETRKRLQKCVYLLQSKGCAIPAQYGLHLYGPYSRDLAEATDELVAEKVLQETEVLIPNVGRSFSYEVSDRGRALLDDYEKSSAGQDDLGSIQPFIKDFVQLNQVDSRRLELAATIAYCLHACGDWKTATKRASLLKEVDDNDQMIAQARGLAESFVT